MFGKQAVALTRSVVRRSPWCGSKGHINTVAAHPHKSSGRRLPRAVRIIAASIENQDRHSSAAGVKQVLDHAGRKRFVLDLHFVLGVEVGGNQIVLSIYLYAVSREEEQR